MTTERNRLRLSLVAVIPKPWKVNAKNNNHQNQLPSIRVSQARTSNEMAQSLRPGQMVPQPYSRMSTPTPGQPFTPPSFTPSQIPSTPGSSHKYRGGFSSGSLYPPGQSPGTPSQLGQYSNWTESLSGDDGPTTAVKGGKVYKKLTIKQSLSQFENVLAKLVKSVSKYQPSVELTEQLIQADAELTDSIAELVVHQQAALKLLRLRKVSAALDEQLNTLLVTLADCRRTLRALPRPDEKYVKALEQRDLTKDLAIAMPDVEPLSQTRVSAKELLHYATKITKFTSAPPGYNRNQPEHANFPWPTEDEMRRGMLALSAIAGTADGGQNGETGNRSVSASASAPPIPKSEDKTASANNHRVDSSNGSSAAQGRRNSMEDYNRPDMGPAEPASTAQLDLDLFDPDEDDDDDDDENMVDI